jgi:endonuclease YncB( thermonuclease family)
MKIAIKSLPLKAIIIAAMVASAALVITLLPPVPTSQASVPITSSFEGQVIRVTDGDSITVRAGEENIKVRLAQIDAPETGQPWGTRSRQELADMVAGRTVIIKSTGQDRYGRTIAQIEADGVDVNRDMITRGAAWAYTTYVTDPSMIEAERTARARATGLWAMPENERIAPWVYRQERRAKQQATTAR